MKTSVAITFLNLWFIIPVVYSPCPHLDPNSNVVVICSKTNSSARDRVQRYFRCGPSTRYTEGHEIGTIAIYQCDKLYKPTSRRFNGARLQCTENGIWTNYAAFRNFQCEIDCGKRPGFYNQLISSGNNTSAKYWPWVATIFRKDNFKYKYSCGGSLIGIRTILTAAHCVTDQYLVKYPREKLRIVLGSISSDFNENLSEGASVHSVRDIFVHPDYDPQTFASDVAIIQLSKSVALTASAFPICLPLSFEEDAVVLSADSVGEISSFGTDGSGQPAKILQHSEFPVLTIANCNNLINIVPKIDQFCAGYLNGPNICKGDSGSGLVFRSHEFLENKYAIHGIVSNTGDLSNDCAPVVLFAKVFTYISWIQEKLITSESLNEKLTNIQFDDVPSKAIESEDKQAATNNCGNSLRASLKISGRSRSRCNNYEDNSGEKYTLAEKTALAFLYPLVKDILLEDYMHNNAYLIRFLRSRNLSLQDTIDMIRATMEWRKENRMNEITKEDFTRYQRDYTVFFQGYDKEGRPVYTTVVRFLDTRKMIETGEVEQFRRYLMRNLEETAEKIRSLGQKNITQCIGIFDLESVDRRKHLCLQCLNIIADFVHAYENYYPQQNYMTYLINLPRIAADGFDAIGPLMSEHTTKTIRVFGNNKEEWSKELLKQIPKDQLFQRYGGTKFVRQGTKRVQLAL